MGVRIVLLGGPGAGKGTQATRLTRAYGVPHISTGDIFRGHIKAGDELGREVEACISAGHLVPDGLTCQLVADRLSLPDCADGYILDGFPRSRPQAACLDQWLSARGERLDMAIHLEVDAEEIVTRLSNRWVCPQCGETYTVAAVDPASMQCDHPDCSGVALIQREDDKAETVRERLHVYAVTSEPVVSFYEEQGLLRSVPGQGMNPDEVFAILEKFVAQAGLSARETGCEQPVK